MKHIVTSKLPYTKQTNGKFRDLRDIEVHLPHRRFARISINGQYRTSKSRKNATRYANPGWSFGTEWYHINWTKFYRHCWHFSINIRKRGVTFSYGKRLT